MLQGNTISIRGRVSSDSKLHQFNEICVINFQLCWQRTKKKDNEFVQEPHFFECKAWVSTNQAAYVMPRLEKGNELVIISGHLEQETWVNKENKHRTKTVIWIDDPIMGMLIVPKPTNIQNTKTQNNTEKQKKTETVEKQTNQQETEVNSSPKIQFEQKQQENPNNRNIENIQNNSNNVVPQQTNQVKSNIQANYANRDKQEKNVAQAGFKPSLQAQQSRQISPAAHASEGPGMRSNLNSAPAFAQNQQQQEIKQERQVSPTQPKPIQQEQSALSGFENDLMPTDIV